MPLAPRLSALALLCTIAAATPAAAQLTSNDRAALGDLEPSFAQRFELRPGWFRGRPILYIDIGPQENTTAAVIVPVTGIDPDGTPRLVPGQRPIFSSLPGLAGYSAIWQLQYLVVPAGYTANTLRDARQALGMSLGGAARLVSTERYLNLAIVPAGSVMDGDPQQRNLKSGWFKGAEVPYFDFGWTRREAAPIYPFVSGFDGDAPQFLRAQHNIVDVVPDSAGPGRDLWDVNFVQPPAGYEPQTIRDRSTLLAHPEFVIRRAGQVRNCPVLIVDGVPAPRGGLSLP